MKYWKLLVYFLLFFSALHLLRDILQIYHVNTPLATILKTNHTFCRPFCDYVTLPPEIFIIIASIISLTKKKARILVLATLGVFFVWISVYIFYLIKETFLHL